MDGQDHVLVDAREHGAHDGIEGDGQDGLQEHRLHAAGSGPSTAQAASQRASSTASATSRKQPQSTGKGWATQEALAGEEQRCGSRRSAERGEAQRQAASGVEHQPDGEGGERGHQLGANSVQ